MGRDPLNKYDRLGQDTIECKYAVFEHSIRLLKEQIDIVRQACTFAGSYLNNSTLIIKPPVVTRKQSRIRMERVEELLTLDKSLGYLYSLQVLVALSNLYALIPSTREYEYVFSMRYACPLFVSCLLLSSFALSYLVKLVNSSQGRAPMIVATVSALAGNILLVHALDSRSRLQLMGAA